LSIPAPKLPVSFGEHELLNPATTKAVLTKKVAAPTEESGEDCPIKTVTYHLSSGGRQDSAVGAGTPRGAPAAATLPPGSRRRGDTPDSAADRTHLRTTIELANCDAKTMQIERARRLGLAR
jgi:hypothetical protein